MKHLIPGLSLFFLTHAAFGQPLFNMEEILDPSTLDIEVLQDWHEVEGKVATRQKLIEIRVGELWPGQDYRIPVRMIVPAKRKAKGFHLTGAHRLKEIRKDARPMAGQEARTAKKAGQAVIMGADIELLKRDVGLVYTLVQFPGAFGKKDLEDAMHERFIQTMDPHCCIHYWGWAATLMRSVTAAYAEADYFEHGKIAVSGGSKNGKSPTVALIHDKRITALHASVSPVWDSPLRLCDKKAWDALEQFNRRDGITQKHRFLGGTFGPNFIDELLAAGHSWNEIRKLAEGLADHLYISRHFEALNARGVDMLFHPGTHDFSAWDIPWGGSRYPYIPIFLKANTGHKQKGHPMAERDERNKEAFLLGHFFNEVDSLLQPPMVKSIIKGKKLLVNVEFPKGSRAESGRIWWMYDRPPDGSNAYLRKLFPDDQWKDMKVDRNKQVWRVEIELDSDADYIDFFSNHRKMIGYRSIEYPTYISSSYTRVLLKK